MRTPATSQRGDDAVCCRRAHVLYDRPVIGFPRKQDDEENHGSGVEKQGFWKDEQRPSQVSRLRWSC